MTFVGGRFQRILHWVVTGKTQTRDDGFPCTDSFPVQTRPRSINAAVCPAKGIYFAPLRSVMIDLPIAFSMADVYASPGRSQPTLGYQ